MSNWKSDIEKMHTKFGVNPVLRDLDAEKLKWFLQFRTDFLQEELNELKKAFQVDNNADDVVDALIDLCVVALGTLDAFDVDATKAWNRVHRANMNKNVGIKPERPNPLGLPDLVKPQGWKKPYHWDNIGLLSKFLDSGKPKK